jgi:hypothetical protein
MKRRAQQNMLLVAASCAATLALVSTVNLSCGSVKEACAQDCPDVATLQQDIADLQQAVEALQSSQTDLEDQVEAFASSQIGRWQLVSRAELTAATAEHEFSGLAGDDDVEYMVRGLVMGATGQVRVELPSIASGMRTQRVSGRDSTASAFSNSSGMPNLIVGFAATTEAPQIVRFEGVLNAASGRPRTWLGISSEIETTTPSLSTDAISGYWSDTSSEVTRIIIGVSEGTLGPGTVLELYRRAH